MVAMDNVYVQSRVVNISTNVQEIVRCLSCDLIMLKCYSNFHEKQIVMIYENLSLSFGYFQFYCNFKYTLIFCFIRIRFWKFSLKWFIPRSQNNSQRFMTIY